MSPTNTRAPSRAKSKAVALPIPEAPPVTTTVRPCISMAIRLSEPRAPAMFGVVAVRCQSQRAAVCAPRRVG